jgi:hypothetical protein
MENGYLEETLERLAAATVQLERTIAGMEERHAHVCGDVEKIVATTEGQQEAIRIELERKLVEAEQKIAVLQAQAGVSAAGMGRRTVSAGLMPMLSKSSVQAGGNAEAGVLDAALNGLSLEQRIAVKSQLMRAGLLS